MRLTKSAVRIGAVIRKEMRELWRRPGALLSLALGPLVVMALFGIGFTGQRGPVDLIVVIPKDLELPRDAAMYQKVAGESAAHIVAVTDDANDARARLSRGEIRMILLAPADLRERIERGEQAQLIAETNELDPIQQGINAVVAETLTREVNAEIIKTAAQQGLARLASSGASPPPVAPDVVARPLRPVVRNNATADPTLLTFFTPAVLALVLQHLGITLTALSMVRERVTGAMDIFRVAPINAVELLVGKYVAYGILGLGIAFALVLGTTNGLHLPFRGSVAAYAVAVILLTFASLGLGLLISLVSDSERQAVQLSMLVLLASMFFSGFVLPVREFREPVRALAYALPVTYGIEIFQQEMLRGHLRETWMQGALAAIAATLFFLSTLRLRVVMRGVG